MSVPTGYNFDAEDLVGEAQDTCAMHPVLTTLLASMRNDIKWLLRIGWTAVAACGGTIVLLVTVIQPYAAGINRDLLAMQAQIAVNTAQLAVLKEADRRSEEDRRDIKMQIQSLHQSHKGN